MWPEVGSGLHPALGHRRECLQIHWASTSGWGLRQAALPQASRAYQPSPHAAPRPGPPASSTALTLKPEAGTGRGDLAPVAHVSSSCRSRKGLRRSSAPLSRSAGLSGPLSGSAGLSGRGGGRWGLCIIASGGSFVCLAESPDRGPARERALS